MIASRYFEQLNRDEHNSVVLKKKVGRKGGRRVQSWTEKLHKKNRRNLVGVLEDQPTMKNPSKKQGQQNIQNQPMQEPSNKDHGHMPSFHPLERINILSQDTNLGLNQFDLMCLTDVSNISLGL